ncbi:hypothetical protein EHQ12_17275 [Leptospira gomenensis]|uniref:Uncharacterized protein n=1 Tax=Leptospira gomenensis TaxID=2484974 RepID=A0A5F1YZJ9_9LEPT|nr:hypothetical protein [Leptospira gomenensis]TGK29485.1 hypothetical protein EHQ17_16060 [Leptospira gomenensis]TGK33612.1 hypothetical protein EHQ12_17275 [Leptospira gomenensis]TGK44853.1 hypothetical protein EHQ07_11230 [Leptospira gomenensis]TGK64472.1 hypothetical protein EHQ13_07310 [Leptospira gomenensis]
MFQNFLRNLFPKKGQPPVFPLRFTKEAEDTIRKHLDRRKESVFRIMIDRTRASTEVKVGYDQTRNSVPLYEYPVRVEIDPEDEVSLEGSRMDWDSETREFRIYPDVDLDVEYQRIRNRFRIETNRYLFVDLFRRKYESKTGYPEWLRNTIDSAKIESLEIEGSVWTFRLNEAYRSEYSDILMLEKELADSILDFFSGFPKRKE